MSIRYWSLVLDTWIIFTQRCNLFRTFFSFSSYNALSLNALFGLLFQEYNIIMFSAQY